MESSDQKYIAADDANVWNYEVAPKGVKCTLLGIGMVQSTGIWTGEYGEAFVAWAPLIKRDKSLESYLARHSFRQPWSWVSAHCPVYLADLHAAVKAQLQGFANAANIEDFQRLLDEPLGVPLPHDLDARSSVEAATLEWRRSQDDGL